MKPLFFINTFIDKSKFRKFKCGYCDHVYYSYSELLNHTEKVHGEDIPSDSTLNQYVYDGTHVKRPLCRSCKTNITPWNEDKMHYEWYCSEKCRKVVVDRLKSPEYQRKMLLGRNISGVYEFSSGGQCEYVGSYALDFLMHCDNVHGFHSYEIQAEVADLGLTYIFEGEKCKYIPDYYMPEYSLVIEIKDGGDNPNTHPGFAPNRVREEAKDKVMMNCKHLNYIKITNKNYEEFDKLVSFFKQSIATNQQIEPGKYKIIPKN